MKGTDEEGQGSLCSSRQCTEYDDYVEVVGEQTKITDLELSRHNMCHGRIGRECGLIQSMVLVSFVRGRVGLSMVGNNTGDALQECTIVSSRNSMTVSSWNGSCAPNGEMTRRRSGALTRQGIELAVYLSHGDGSKGYREVQG